MNDITYQFEYGRRIRSVFIGAGGHSFRNVYPSLNYAPVDLLAVCDIDSERGRSYARMFGAATSYTDHREMLEEEHPDAVFVVTSYDEDGRVQATRIAEECLLAGADVWMEKPTAASSAEVRRLQEISRTTGRRVMTGLKKTFTPAMRKVRSIIESPEFGAVSTISVRYPQSLPPEHHRDDRNRMRGFLDHIYHPGAILTFLGGPVSRLSYEWEPVNGGSVASLLFESGAVGALHLAAGSAANSPLERVEVVGEGGNVVIDNSVRVTYYRAGATPTYGREPSYIVADDIAPLMWEPEFSLGQLYNKNLFYLGYVPEILHFCEAILDDRPLTMGTLDQALQIMALYETFQRLPAGTPGAVVTHEENGAS